MRISDWSSDVFSSDLAGRNAGRDQGDAAAARQDRQPDQPSLSAAGRGRSIRRRRDAAIGQGHDRVRRRMNTDSKPLLADLVRAGDQQTEAVVITDFIFMAKDISNDYLITTADGDRSEEHTSELQSLMRISYAVFCLKKKTS